MFLHVNELLSDLSLKQIISGQYVSTNHTASTYIEVEVIGIPVDCVKHKTKVVSRNALNPIWNDLFSFQVSQQLQIQLLQNLHNSWCNEVMQIYSIWCLVYQIFSGHVSWSGLHPFCRRRCQH